MATADTVTMRQQGKATLQLSVVQRQEREQACVRVRM
jgi:hypothetical protein